MLYTLFCMLNVIKIFEKIIKNKSDQLIKKYHMHNFQHGFRKKRSCLTELIDYYNNTLDSVTRGKNVYVVYLNFCKAFHLLDHQIALHKAPNLGICSKLLIYLKESLTNLQQRTIMQSWASDLIKVRSGVTQDRVLIP